MAVISGIFFIALFLTIWLKTNAFVEYMQLFKLDKFFHVKDYMDMQSNQSYPEFLVEYYNSFFTRLISCPICLSVWLGLIISLCTSLLALPILSFFGLSLYLLVSKLL
jgi:hypothetical protein